APDAQVEQGQGEAVGQPGQFGPVQGVGAGLGSPRAKSPEWAPRPVGGVGRWYVRAPRTISTFMAT
ncbi:hypothetical protein, partial [Streptomyces zhihengii]